MASYVAGSVTSCPCREVINNTRMYSKPNVILINNH